MKKFITLFSLILSLGIQFLHSQKVDTIRVAGPDSVAIANDTTAYAFAEIMPRFHGGGTAFSDYLAQNTKYPQEEKKARKQGTVYVQFVVEKDGSVTNVKLIRGVPDAPGLGAEAVRVVSESPKWNPALMNGKPVRCSMTIPIKFAL